MNEHTSPDNRPVLSEPFYRLHVFCCVNQRAPGHPRSCCADRGAVALRDYMKDRAKLLGIPGTRINQAGCLERCELGPTMVIYPEGVWYTYQSEADVDEILERHLLRGERVERLQLANDQRVPLRSGPQALTLRVARVRQLTQGSHDIKAYELAAEDGVGLPPFTAGAHIDVLTGIGRRCSYSLANDPAERHRYVIGVQREAVGRGGSEWLHEHVREGSQLTVTLPRNNFRVAAEASEHLLIAGGIGITPLLAMGHELKAQGARFVLHYVTRSEGDTAFAEEVRAVFADRVHFYHDDGDPMRGLDLGALLADRPAGAHVYVCGPTGLIDAARAAAASRWPAEAVHYELFSPTVDREAQANAPFDVFLSRRRLTLEVPADKTILEVVRAAGVDADFACESGICSACRTRVISGLPDHRDNVLTAAEKANNSHMMICVSRAARGETLTLDL